jgi:hypothetical protein
LNRFFAFIQWWFSDPYWKSRRTVTLEEWPSVVFNIVFAVCVIYVIYQPLARLGDGGGLAARFLLMLLAIPLFFVIAAGGVLVGNDLERNRRYGWIRYVVVAGVAIFVFFDTKGERQRLRGDESATEVPVRDVSVEELLARRRDAGYKWFADIEDAGAHGPAGVEPPMLIVEDQRGTVSIENISDRAIACIALQRGQSSCALESELPECTPLEPRDSRVYRLSGAADCGNLPVEYRIGSLEFPEVSWWSDSALARWRHDLDAVEAGSEFARDSGDAVRRAELFYRYEAQLADVSRASQWKSEQARWESQKTAWQTFRRAPNERDMRMAWSKADGDSLDELARVFAARHYGPPAAIPTLLEVRDDEHGIVAIVNRSKGTLIVRATRARERQSPFESAHCALSTQEGQHVPEPLSLSPGSGAFLYSTFEARTACTREPRGALEFTLESERGLEWITISRVHDYLDIAPSFVDNPPKQLAAERARRARQVAKPR